MLRYRHEKKAKSATGFIVSESINRERDRKDIAYTKLKGSSATVAAVDLQERGVESD